VRPRRRAGASPAWCSVRSALGLPFDWARGATRLTTKGRSTVAEKYEGYCVKCKEKRTFDGEVRTSESGRRMAQGICPVCGTKMNRILGKA
jgi:Zn finger protein HypA/HybF involved in hydrogenase expression